MIVPTQHNQVELSIQAKTEMGHHLEALRHARARADVAHDAETLEDLDALATAPQRLYDATMAGDTVTVSTLRRALQGAVAHHGPATDLTDLHANVARHIADRKGAA